jgi:predicted MPP superfamily phosphohydrolase
MFHTIITLSYTIPGLYLFIRIWQRFISRKDRYLYVIFFTALFSIYPLSNYFEGRGFISKVLQTSSGYLLPFYLYMFLLILLTDLLLLVNLLKIISPERLRAPVIRKRTFLTIITLSCLIVIAGAINFNTIKETTYNVDRPAKSTDLENLKIAFISDFHLDERVPLRFVRKYADEIEKIKPDVILYGGDIIEGNGENIEDSEGIIRNLKSKFGSFAVLGNHDHVRNYRNNFFTRAGITLLTDSIATDGKSFAIVGRKDSRMRKTAEELINKVPSGLPVIVLDHRPTESDQISKAGADLSFSGHTHKGQLFPLNFYLEKMYELSYGHMKKSNTDFFVSSGIRLWGLPVRTTGKSEIVVVNVNFLH